MIAPLTTLLNSGILLGLVGGILIGFIFFGGLRLTLKLSARLSNPIPLVLVSYLARLLILFFGLAALARFGGIEAILSATVGLTIMLFAGSLLFGRPA